MFRFSCILKTRLETKTTVSVICKLAMSGVVLYSQAKLWDSSGLWWIAGAGHMEYNTWPSQHGFGAVCSVPGKIWRFLTISTTFPIPQRFIEVEEYPVLKHPAESQHLLSRLLSVVVCPVWENPAFSALLPNSFSLWSCLLPPGHFTSRRLRTMPCLPSKPKCSHSWKGRVGGN